jgi:Protein of unknown function (DUF2971)
VADILYKYLPAEYGFRTIEDKMVKLSTIGELNDIYDCSRLAPPSAGWPNYFSEDQFDKVVRQLHQKYGLLCLSKKTSSPALWGHYAQGGKGLALGFDCSRFVNGQAIGVLYDDARPAIELPRTAEMSVMEAAILRQTFQMKSSEWVYEQEVRLVLSLDDDNCVPKAGMYFFRFTLTAIQEVITGPRFSDDAYLRRLLNTHIDSAVRIRTAQEIPGSYRLDVIP